MAFTLADTIAFFVYVIGVVLFAMWMSRREESSEDYFLAGRRLTWFLIGISLIASNISTEHFVGMAGAGFDTGLAIACYEWTAAVAIVIVGLFLLPKFLRRGIYTIPQFLEYRYSLASRGLMAFYMMAAYVFVIISAVLYSGAVALDAIFGDSIRQLYEQSGLAAHLDLPRLFGSQWVLICGVWFIGLLAGIYTVWGGLKAVVWADLWNGLGLLLGGVLVTVLGLIALSNTLGSGQGILEGLYILFARADDKLSAVKPWNHPEVPWIAVFIGGLWIPQFFYWGLNQFITQRALGARSIAQGQKGLMFAATLKLLIPFVIVLPGIMAFEMFAASIDNKDKAYPFMIRQILYPGLRGVMLAALFGAVMSSLDSMLNSASTIFTIDLYKRYLRPQAADRTLLRLGRWITAFFVLLACVWAPQLGWIAGAKGVFDYIQKTWGLITPGIVTVFFFGLTFRKATAQAALGAMLLGPAFYMWCLKAMPEVAFLHHMAFTFIVLTSYMFVVTLLAPLKDVEQQPGEPAPAAVAQRPRGFVRRILIPWGTAAFGAYLMGEALFSFSWYVLTVVFAHWKLGDVPEWLPFVTTLVPVGIYCIATIALLSASYDHCRRVLPRSQVRLTFGRLVVKPVWTLVVAAVFAAIVGLHAYMFSDLVFKSVEKKLAKYAFFQQTVEITVPTIVKQYSWQERLADAAGVNVQQTPVIDPPAGEQPSGEEPQAQSAAEQEQGQSDSAAQESSAQAPDEQQAEETAEEASEASPEEATEEEAETGPPPVVFSNRDKQAEPSNVIILTQLGHLALGYRTLTLRMFPTVVAVAFGVAFFLAWLILAIAGRRPEVEVEAATPIDMRPSVIAPLWGLLVIVGAVVIYYFFF